MSNPWKHPICPACFDAKHPGKPQGANETRRVRCCFCGAYTTAGLTTPQDPTDLACRGEHGVASW